MVTVKEVEMMVKEVEELLGGWRWAVTFYQEEGGKKQLATR